MHAFRRGRSLVAAAALVSGLAAALPTSHASIVSLAEQVAAIAPPPAFDRFLNRLMAAESGGRSDAKNPRSTALGPFQFIKTTFLDITRRHFPEEIAGLSEAQILERRKDPDLSRRAATAYCKESVTYLQAHGLEPTFAHLRLAYLLGPADAARIMHADGERPVAQLLSPAVVKANPFLRSMRVTDLLAKSGRDVTGEPPSSHAVGAERASPSPPRKASTRPAHRRCNDKLAACRKFQARAKSGAGKSRGG